MKQLEQLLLNQFGEPGTQLTMRTFHTGGVAGSDITQGLHVSKRFSKRNPKGQAVITEIEGVVEDIKLAKDRQQEIVVKGANETRSYLASRYFKIKSRSRDQLNEEKQKVQLSRKTS